MADGMVLIAVAAILAVIFLLWAVTNAYTEG